MPKLKNKAQKTRFAGVGAIATAIDFTVLFGLHFLGMNRILANFFSTFVAFLFSFALNRSFTFKVTSGNKVRQLGLFFLVTFSGLWILQPIVIWLSSMALDVVFSETITLLIAKLIATGFSLVWNYIFYSKVVFPADSRAGD